MIVYCCQDLIFATRIRATAESLNITSRPTRDTQALAKRLDRVDDGKANDPVTGVMVDLGMGQAALDLIGQTKAHDAAIPVIAFGSHVDRDALAAARDHGADQVLPRSAFTARLPDLLQTLAPTL